MATKKEIEEKLVEVEKAEDQVKAIETERAAKRAEKQAKRLTWWGPFKCIGKGINAVENNPKTFGLGMLVGGPVGALAFYGVKKGIEHFKGKETDEDETPVLESEVAPFDTEA